MDPRQDLHNHMPIKSHRGVELITSRHVAWKAIGIQTDRTRLNVHRGHASQPKLCARAARRGSPSGRTKWTHPHCTLPGRRSVPSRPRTAKKSHPVCRKQNCLEGSASTRPARGRIREISSICQWKAAEKSQESVVWDFKHDTKGRMTERSAREFL